MSRSAQVVGGAWEAFLEEHHDRALQRGILAHAIHNQATSRVVDGRLIYAGKGGADYSLVFGNGLAGAAEAKSTKEGRLQRSAIQVKQAAHLDAVAAVGGIALLLVEFRETDVPYRCAVPWLEVPWETKRVAQSVGWGALQQWVIEGDCYLSKFFAGTGTPCAPIRRRVFARE